MLPRMAPSSAVALIGCGNIGFRHLQAITSGAEPATVTVVEPNVAAHERINEYIEQEAGSSSKDVVLVTEMPESPRAFDLVVVATTTDTRRAVVDALLDRHQVKVLILEKVLFPRVADLEEIGKRLENLGVTTFVNCGRRTFPGYKAIREEFHEGGVRSISVRGNGFGLASGAVHCLDLAEFLTGAEVSTVSAARLDPGYVPSKRAGCVEVFGTLTAQLSDGSSLVIECRDADPMVIEYVIEGPRHVVRVDELAQTVTTDAETRAFVSQPVSATTGVYDDALRTGTCELTPYADSARQHRVLLDAIRPHLGLSNESDDPCPIS